MWDVNVAIKYLDQHANLHSLGRCAEYTRKAIEAGGLTLKHAMYAKDYGSSLTTVGFRPLVMNVGDFRAGDVVIIEGCNGAPAGHMAMFDGRVWVSDFKQSALYPGSAYRKARPKYTVYRFVVLWDSIENPNIMSGLA